jgi:hypothetical protein
MTYASVFRRYSIFFGIALLAMTPLLTGVHAEDDLKPLSETEMSDVTAKEGLKIEIDDWSKLSIAEISLTDGDGYNGGDEGSITFGNGDNEAINLNNTAMTGITIDVSSSNGIVIGPPSGTLTLTVNETYLGSPDTTFGFEVLDLNVNQSQFEITSQ